MISETQSLFPSDFPIVEFRVPEMETMLPFWKDEGLVRSGIKKKAQRLIRIFEWGIKEELVPTTHPKLLRSALDEYKKGRVPGLKEATPIRAVPPELVAEAVETLPPILATMVQLQASLGMRPGEVCRMRPCDITWDREQCIGVYRDYLHKNTWREDGDAPRAIPFGLTEYELLEPYLNRPAESNLFSPAENHQHYLDEKFKNRKTPLSCGNKPGSNRKANPKKQKGEFWTPQSYGKAVQSKLKKLYADEYKEAEASLTDDQLKVWKKKFFWSPNQLRKTCATAIGKDNIRVAQIQLGHKSLSTTERFYDDLSIEPAVDWLKRRDNSVTQREQRSA